MVNARYLGTFVLGMILFNTMFFSIEGAAQDRDPEFVDALKQQPHIVWPDCIITDIDGKILKKMIGYLCVPFSDGTYLSTNDKYLRFFSADNEIVNKLEIYPHHQLKTHSNDTRILAIGSKYSEYKGKKNRFDVIYEISREGDILKEFDFGRNFSKYLAAANIQTEIEPWYYPENTKENQELTHINSIYRIEKNSLSGKVSGFAEGNYIVNDNLLKRIVILGPKLEKIVKIFPFVKGTEAIHDVSVKKDGNLLLFNNLPEGYNTQVSSIDIWNPTTLAVVKRYQPHNPKEFSQYKCGGVQELESGEYMFYDNNLKVNILSKNFKFKSKAPMRPFEYQDLIQEIKAGDHSEFLKNNVEW